MFAVIFEVQPRPGRTDRYLEIAAALRPRLEQVDGFLAVERFASRRRDGRILSLSLWRDERAIGEWRRLGDHSAAQQRGRAEIFADYRIRVGEIVADSTPPEPGAKYVTISELAPAAAVPPGDAGLSAAGPEAAVDSEFFVSLTNSGKLLLLVAWQDGAAAGRWHPASHDGRKWGHRRARILRDYGMFERVEAPQYYPPVPQVRTS
jgi:heme-degrading monooxygenase HmoA